MYDFSSVVELHVWCRWYYACDGDKLGRPETRAWPCVIYIVGAMVIQAIKSMNLYSEKFCSGLAKRESFQVPQAW